MPNANALFVSTSINSACVNFNIYQFQHSTAKPFNPQSCWYTMFSLSSCFYIYIYHIYIIIYIHTHFCFTYLVAATPKKMPNSIYILHISSYRPTFLSWHLWGYQTCYPTWLFHIAVTRKSPLLSSMESMGHGFAMQQWLFIIRPIVDPWYSIVMSLYYL